VTLADYGREMNLDLRHLTDLHDGDLAAILAEQAGVHLLSLRTSRLAGDTALDEETLNALGDEADRTANDLIVGALRELRPKDSILSEESTDDLARLDADRVWIVDPLDGTREYKIAGNSEWAVHIALWVRSSSTPKSYPPKGDAPKTQAAHDQTTTSEITTFRATTQSGPTREGSLTLGAVGLPALGTVLRSDRPLPPPTVPQGRLRIVRSASRSQPLAEGVAKLLEGELVAMGSAGAKAMAVVRGEADAYIHTGGQWEWDSAAPVIVAQGHGLFVMRVDGSPIRYNQQDPYLPDLVMCRAGLADRLMAAVREVRKTLD
jgi:3'(2'), 5'-bisphosphate nucleotidase